MTHATPEDLDAGREYLEHDYARNQLRGEPAREAHRNAEQVLREHPNARSIALAATSQELGGLPRHLRAHQRRWRSASGVDARRAAEIRRRGYQPISERQAQRRTYGQTARENLKTGASAIPDLGKNTAGWAANTSFGETILDILLWGAGLSIFYLLLTKAAATAKLAEGASNAVRAVISPTVDPLNPFGATQASMTSKTNSKTPTASKPTSTGSSPTTTTTTTKRHGFTA